MDINHWNLVTGSSVSPNPLQNMAYRNIHVLLVEHESRDHDNIINLLHYFSYKVTSVKLLSIALSTLSKGKVEFDLVMVNMNSPDSSLGFQLLQDAAKMKLLVIFMSNEDDVVTTMRALEQGAFLCIRKPLSMAILGSLWQFVLSEKSRRSRETEPFTKLIDNYNYNSQEKVVFEKHILECNYQNYYNFEEKETNSNGGGYKRKAWAEWTLDLHRKFMDAAKSLGEGKCFPKEILEIMNVPGLTRMQVASHLQKCRNAKWLPPNERKLKLAANREKAPKRETKPPKVRTLKFGVMPFWEEEISSQFDQAIQEYNEDVMMNSPVFGHDDHGFYPLYSDNIMGLDQQFVFGDYNQSVAPLTNFSPSNLITENPFELFPIMDSEMVDEFPHFQQDLVMDLDLDEYWEAFILDGGKHDQVSDAVKKGSHDVYNPDMENEQAEEADKGGLKV